MFDCCYNSEHVLKLLYCQTKQPPQIFIIISIIYTL